MREWSALIKRAAYMAVITMGMLVLASPAFPSEFAHERVIHLKGTTNTRDIGGYQNSAMGTLRWGQIIRSDNLSRLTTGDFQKLEEIGIKTVIDLRTQKEHDQSPTVWTGDKPPRFFHFPVGDSDNDWFTAQRKMMKRNRFSQEQSLEHMIEGYRMIAEEGASSYRKLMEIVLDESNWPVLIHCSAGKDRSGIAVALILESLNIDRETIMEEYLLTNEISRIEEKAVFLSKESKSSSRGNKFSKGTPASAWLPIVGVDARMLEAFYARVDERYGSMEAYLTELGADQDARRALAASLIMEQPRLAMGK
ncbi:MAG TPA: tyrosine-protein phosphatase [Xanthomonadales bacterium]